MRRPALILLACSLFAGGVRAESAPVPLQRFTLVIGANIAGGDRPRLQYAVSDAERFARVMIELGGVAPANEIVLRQPRLRDLVDALDQLSARVADARRKAGADGRTEVVVYYSGHADEQGLLIGDDRYSYRSLRDRLDQIPADVRIAVLDACASGAFTRIKGGRARPAFLVDQSTSVRGHAFLTSSAATEVAQESDRIRASYFTHYLISGFRGAADLSGDGRITLSEAYQFALDETLRRTVDTKGGAQHPSWDINLSGTGDVVMTDVRQTTATLVLAEELEGRFFVRNAAEEMIVELYKPRGRRVELGIEPGSYAVRLELQKAPMVATVQIADGAKVVVDRAQFGPAAVEATRRRGDASPARFAVEGRDRIEIRWGFWRASGSGGTDVGGASVVTSYSNDDSGGIHFTHYMRENLAITFGFNTVDAVHRNTVEPGRIASVDSGVIAVPIGVHWNPVRGEHRLQRLKPYLATSVGPAIGYFSDTFVGGGSVSNSREKVMSLGGHVGAGVDLHVFRSVSVGINAGYNWMLDLRRFDGTHANFSGPEIGFSLGWLFGKGTPRTH
jgi:hypothetical protein